MLVANRYVVPPQRWAKTAAAFTVRPQAHPVREIDKFNLFTDTPQENRDKIQI